jgi:ribonuclease-3
MTAAMPSILSAAGIGAIDAELLRLALTHASKSKAKNNERLEFLGDRVLSLAVADMIYARYPDESEGDLALRHAALVRAETLARIARAHGLSRDVLAVGDGADGPAQLDNVLADTFEALMGALYLDQGYPVCAAAVKIWWGSVMDDMAVPPRDPKSMVQEWAQGRGLPLPDYQLIERMGPDHAPEFLIELRVKGCDPVRATGPTRRQAEKEAARILIESLPS